jgi:hypothetical protein
MNAEEEKLGNQAWEELCTLNIIWIIWTIANILWTSKPGFFCLQIYFAKINKLVLPATAVVGVSQQRTQVYETTYPSQVPLPLPCTWSSIEK